MAAGKPLDHERITREIVAGRQDAHLFEFTEAIGSRVEAGEFRIGWRIRFRGLNVGERDLTLDEAIKVEAATMTGWLELSPMLTAHHCAALLKVLMMTRQNKTEDEVAELFKTVTVAEVTGSIRPEDTEPVPFDGAPASG